MSRAVGLRLQQLVDMAECATVLAWLMTDPELLEAVVELGAAEERARVLLRRRMDEYPI